ncbi:hypothetical protein ACFR99_00365 [Haloarchaeobius amylolyticus]|uniref:Uncharacterized protein n=1 Tax=Haloarchaeobius amylolyticus TaxID=1198296 RepID=A0ABD6BAG4_9EURY
MAAQRHLGANSGWGAVFLAGRVGSADRTSAPISARLGSTLLEREETL